MTKSIVFKSFITVLFLAVFVSSKAQVLRGVVVDQLANIPLIQANVVLSDSIVVSTDDEGVFRFENLAVGNYNLSISYIGYEEVYLPNVYVDAGKDKVVNIPMIEALNSLSEVVVTATKERSKALNEMSLISTKLVGVEETKKYASSFNDPARMANSFAGVVQTDAGSNHIAIRGNAPNGLLWRLEGMDIPNPNHFSNVGTAGGGVSILSGQLLADSDFSTGAFAAEYGNALSGVFDIKLRNGNDEKREYTFQVGVLGLDAAIEGPFTNSGNNSYLVNYRYSTLGILSKSIDLGGFVTTFQDLSYNVSFKNSKLGNISFFGLNGLSGQTGYDSIYLYDLDFKANTLVNGMTHSKSIGSNGFWKSSILYATTENSIFATETDEDLKESYNAYSESHFTKRLSFSSKYQQKLNTRVSFKTGLTHNLIWYDEFKKERESLQSEEQLFYDVEGNTSNSQLYFQTLFRNSQRMLTSVGVHYLYNWLNDTQSLEPRLSLSYQMNSKNKLSFGYGLHSQIPPLGVYLFEKVQGGDVVRPNLSLDMSKAHHIVLGYEFSPHPLWNMKMEAYYQSLFNVPLGLDDIKNTSLLNLNSSTLDEELTNDGKGRNYGLELTIDKYLDKGYYLSCASSIYNSEFKTVDGQWFDTRFNGGFSNSITAGKEMLISSSKNRVLGIHIKSIFAGGLRQNPIDTDQSILQDDTVYDYSVPFSYKLPNYYRFDFKVSVKRNYKNVTTSWVFDIQNVFNRKNIGYEDYNPSTQKVERFTQVGLLPIIAYKVEF